MKHFKTYTLNFLVIIIFFSFSSSALGCPGSLLWWAGFSSFVARPPEPAGQRVQLTGLAAHDVGPSFLDQEWNLGSYMGGWILDHWATRAVLLLGYFDFIFLCFTVNLSTFVVSFTEKNR